jgi:F-box/leucine-rich repeat protein 10/11
VNEKKNSPPVDKASEEGHHSNLSPTSPPRSGKALKRERVSFVENEADPESLRLIRELQEQEFGLRRRGTRT